MFLLQSSLAVLGIGSLTARTEMWKRVLLALLFFVPLILIARFVRLDPTISVRSSYAWWKDPLWRDMVLFALMLAGMEFRVLWDAMERQEQDSGLLKTFQLGLSGRDFVRPALVSLLVFQGVLFLAKTQELSVELGLASFENGFFWNALFNGIRLSVEGGTRKSAKRAGR